MDLEQVCAAAGRRLKGRAWTCDPELDPTIGRCQDAICANAVGNARGPERLTSARLNRDYPRGIVGAGKACVAGRKKLVPISGFSPTLLAGSPEYS
jgi:hypothetical protein